MMDLRVQWSEKSSRKNVDSTRATNAGSSLAAAGDAAVRCVISIVSETDPEFSGLGKAGEWEWADK